MSPGPSESEAYANVGAASLREFGNNNSTVRREGRARIDGDQEEEAFADPRQSCSNKTFLGANLEAMHDTISEHRSKASRLIAQSIAELACCKAGSIPA